MQCFILAGGFATRLWPLTEHRAKPLLPLAGFPLLTHLVTKIPVGIPITVSTNAVFKTDIEKWAKTIKTHTVNVRNEDSGKDEHKLGALGAVRAWIEADNIKDDVLLLAGDNFVGFDLKDLIKEFHGDPLLAAHDIVDRELARAFGTVITKSDATVSEVTGFEEKPASPKSTLVSTGCYVLPSHQLPVLIEFAKLHPDNIGGLFEEFLKRGIRVECRVFKEMWRDIGSFQSYLETHKDLLQGKSMTDPTATITESTLTESVYIGPKTVVSKSYLKNCLLFGNSMIEDCILEDCIIDEGVTLRHTDFTGKMIRRGSNLSRNN